MNFAFMPDTLTIRVGQTVTWINNDETEHTATSDTSVFDSGFLAPGQSFTFRFTSTGTFPYFCQIHPDMVGRIIVTN
jgi:plastocyanin